MASLVHKLSIENVTNGSCLILDNCKWQFDFVNAHVIFGVKKKNIHALCITSKHVII